MNGAVAKEKNVNIDKFKLGEEEEEAEEQSGACGRNFEDEGACARACDDDVEDELEELKKPKDINVFDDWSPSKEKNNAKLAKAKVNKTNVNIVINNTRDEKLDNVQNEEEEKLNEDDDDMDPKMYVHVSPDQDQNRNV